MKKSNVINRARNGLRWKLTLECGHTVNAIHVDKWVNCLACPSPFETELKTKILEYIRTAKLDGTTGMSVDNLRQCVRAPSNGIEGAPVGTNARYMYAQLFRDVCRLPVIAPFIIEDADYGAMGMEDACGING